LQDIVGEEVVNDLTTRGVSEADASLIVKHSMYMFLGLLHKTLQAWLIKHVVAVFQLIVPIIGLVDSDTWEDITVVPNWPIPLVWDGHTELHLVSVLAIVVCLACRGGDGGAHEGATSRAVRLETMGADMITKHATIMNVLTQHLLKEISELKSNKWWQDVVTSISILGLRRAILLRAIAARMYTVSPTTHNNTHNNTLVGTNLEPFFVQNGWLRRIGAALHLPKPTTHAHHDTPPTPTWAACDRVMFSVSEASDQPVMATKLGYESVVAMHAAATEVVAWMMSLYVGGVVFVLNGNGKAFRLGNAMTFGIQEAVSVVERCSGPHAEEVSAMTDFLSNTPTVVVRWLYTANSNSPWWGCDLGLVVLRVVYIGTTKHTILQIVEVPAAVCYEQTELRGITSPRGRPREGLMSNGGHIVENAIPHGASFWDDTKQLQLLLVDGSDNLVELKPSLRTCRIALIEHSSVGFVEKLLELMGVILLPREEVLDLWAPWEDMFNKIAAHKHRCFALTSWATSSLERPLDCLSVHLLKARGITTRINKTFVVGQQVVCKYGLSFHLQNPSNMRPEVMNHWAHAREFLATVTLINSDGSLQVEHAACQTSERVFSICLREVRGERDAALARHEAFLERAEQKRRCEQQKALARSIQELDRKQEIEQQKKEALLARQKRRDAKRAAKCHSIMDFYKSSKVIQKQKLPPLAFSIEPLD